VSIHYVVPVDVIAGSFQLFGQFQPPTSSLRSMAPAYSSPDLQNLLATQIRGMAAKQLQYLCVRLQSTALQFLGCGALNGKPLRLSSSDRTAMVLGAQCKCPISLSQSFTLSAG
jgi:hypothetical protein